MKHLTEALRVSISNALSSKPFIDLNPGDKIYFCSITDGDINYRSEADFVAIQKDKVKVEKWTGHTHWTFPLKSSSSKLLEGGLNQDCYVRTLNFGGIYTFIYTTDENLRERLIKKYTK